MNSIRIDFSKAMSYIKKDEIIALAPMIEAAHSILHNRSNVGGTFLGWVNHPVNYDKEEFLKIINTAKIIRKSSDVFVVVGIGGSYLGSRAAIEMFNHSFANLLPKDRRKNPLILFAGNSISSSYLTDLMEAIQGLDVSINVISKSGTTIETAIAFRILKEYLYNKYGKEEAKKRIYVTTDKSKGALKNLATSEDYETFVIPDDIGGRYSVLTAVGLLPIAVAGIDIKEIMKGAEDARISFGTLDISRNICYQYVAARNCLLRKGKNIEMLANYEPTLHYFGEWWKQLFGESEGKDHKGIFPATVDFSSDLLSLGQYIQDGMRNIFETVIHVEEASRDIIIPANEDDTDGINYLAGKTMSYVNEKAFQGTAMAHQDGGVPNIIINVPKLSPYYFGYLVYFFEKACAISGYLNGINPFNQEGVEEYKNNMFALLGKPGYEELRDKLEKAYR